MKLKGYNWYSGKKENIMVNNLSSKSPFLPLLLSLLLPFFLLLATPSAAQTLNFGIYKGSDKIGDLVVEKTITESKVRYEANSKSYFRIIFQNEWKTSSSAEFVNEELAYCMAKTTHNGKVKEHAITKKTGDTYTYFHLPDISVKKKAGPFRLSTLGLYYMEPTDIKMVFSESFQELCPVKPLGNHTYEVILPGDKINHYVYENGQLMEIKVFRTLVDLSFKRMK